MKVVDQAANVPEADILTGMLESRGIKASVLGRDLQTVVGAAAVQNSARVLVHDQDYEAARAVIAEYEQAQPSMPEQDKSSQRHFRFLGIFSKPALFWLTVLLLLYWLFFSGVPNPFPWEVTIILPIGF